MAKHIHEVAVPTPVDIIEKGARVIDGRMEAPSVPNARAGLARTPATPPIATTNADVHAETSDQHSERG